MAQLNIKTSRSSRLSASEPGRVKTRYSVRRALKAELACQVWISDRFHQWNANKVRQVIDDGKARYSDPSRSADAGKQGGTAKILFVPVMERFCFFKFIMEVRDENQISKWSLWEILFPCRFPARPPPWSPLLFNRSKKRKTENEMNEIYREIKFR